MNSRLVQYAVAATLVRLADEGARVVLPLLALSRTGSAAPGGAMVAALLVPHVLAAPAVGVLADRRADPHCLSRLPVQRSPQRWRPRRHWLVGCRRRSSSSCWSPAAAAARR